MKKFLFLLAFFAMIASGVAFAQVKKDKTPVKKEHVMHEKTTHKWKHHSKHMTKKKPSGKKK
jgi:Ni/Co efflux regulator RcnB